MSIIPELLPKLMPVKSSMMCVAVVGALYHHERYEGGGTQLDVRFAEIMRAMMKGC